MGVVIVGPGIGRMTLALSLRKAGIAAAGEDNTIAGFDRESPNARASRGPPTAA